MTLSQVSENSTPELEEPPMTSSEVDRLAEATSPVNRQFLAAVLDNCSQEHDIFMIRYKGLRDALENPESSDDQVRKSFTTLKRAMTDFRMALKSIPGKL